MTGMFIETRGSITTRMPSPVSFTLKRALVPAFTCASFHYRTISTPALDDDATKVKR